MSYECVPYAARTGRHILFPNWLKHTTLPNTSSKDRIIVGFNFRFIPITKNLKAKSLKASSAARVRGGALIGKPPAVSYKDPALVSYKDPGTVFIKEAYKIN